MESGPAYGAICSAVRELAGLGAVSHSTARAALGPAVPVPGMRHYTANEATAFHGGSAEVEESLGRLRVGEREPYVIEHRSPV